MKTTKEIENAVLLLNGGSKCIPLRVIPNENIGKYFQKKCLFPFVYMRLLQSFPTYRIQSVIIIGGIGHVIMGLLK